MNPVVSDLLTAARAHLAARDALAEANVNSLKTDDPRFADVVNTLARLRAVVASCPVPTQEPKP